MRRQHETLDGSILYCVDTNDKPIRLCFGGYVNDDHELRAPSEVLQKLIDNVNIRPSLPMYYYANDKLLPWAVKFFADDSSVIVIDRHGRYWRNGELCNSTQVCSYR